MSREIQNSRRSQSKRLIQQTNFARWYHARFGGTGHMPVSVGLGARMTPVLYLDVQIFRLSLQKTPLEFIPDVTPFQFAELLLDADGKTF
jgi:hypothetical protein